MKTKLQRLSVKDSFFLMKVVEDYAFNKGELTTDPRFKIIRAKVRLKCNSQKAN